MTRPCPRRFELDALREGRLGPSEQERLRDHVRRCRACAAEERFAEELRRELSAPTTFPDALALRRHRYKTLDAAGRAMRDGDGRRRHRTVLVFALALGAVLGICLMVVRGGDRGILIQEASPRASWTRIDGANHERRIHLSDGALQFNSRGRRGGDRLIVEVPDGTIEDLGTVFRVAVAGRKTTEISVTEGAIVFRRPGAPDLHIPAGVTWTASSGAPRQIAAAPSASPPPSAAPPPAAVPVKQRRPAPAVPEVGCADEDSLYMEIVGLLRERRITDARARARAYLRRCPSGFRRAEVQHVLDAP